MAVIEIASFRLAQGVTEDQFLVENGKVESDHVVHQPGFLSRQTAQGEDDEWLVIVHWESTEAADASMEGFMDAPATQAFLGAIDSDTYSMKRYSVVEDARSVG